MRLPVLLFGLVLGIGVLLAAAMWTGEATPQALPHPDYPSLLRATDGAARLAPVWWIGAALGALEIAFFAACFALGLRRQGSLGPLARPLWLGLALYEAVYVLLLIAYRAFLAAPTSDLVLSFPAPTTVMLFGLWPVPLCFLWIYLRHFDDWVLREEDLLRVRRLAAPPAEGREGRFAVADDREPD